MTGFRLQTLYQNAQAAQGISGLGRGTSFSRTHLDDTARKIGLHGFKLRTNQGRGCELSDLAYNGHLATKGSRSVGLPCRGCLWSTSSAPRGCWRERCWVYLFEPFLRQAGDSIHRQIWALDTRWRPGARFVEGHSANRPNTDQSLRLEEGRPWESDMVRVANLPGAPPVTVFRTDRPPRETERATRWMSSKFAA